MKSLMALLLLSLPLLSFAQPPDTLWTRTVGTDTLDEIGYSVQPTPDGGFIIAGTSQNRSILKWMLAKISATGETEWVRTYGNGINEESQIFCCPTQGGEFLMARSEGTVLCLTRLSAAGDSIRSNFYPDSLPQAFKTAALAADGGSLLLCRDDEANCDIFAVRVDSLGNQLWSRTWGTGGFDYPRAAVEMPNGDWMVLLWLNTFDSIVGRVLRISAAGDSLWALDDPVTWYSSALALSGGGCVVGGPAQGMESTMALISDTGRVEWWRDCSAMSDMQGILAYRAGQVISLHSMSNIDVCRFGLLCTQLGGDTLWSWTHDVYLDCEYTVGAATLDGGLILSCNVETALNDHDFYLVRLAFPNQAPPAPRAALAGQFDLAAYPNPFNPSTTISFTVPRNDRVRLTIVNLLGREVKILSDNLLTSGEHRILFDGSDLPSGIYFVRIQSGNFVAAKKLLLLK